MQQYDSNTFFVVAVMFKRDKLGLRYIRDQTLPLTLLL